MVGSVVTDLLRILSSSPPDGSFLVLRNPPKKTNKQTLLSQTHTHTHTQEQQILPTSEEEEEEEARRKKNEKNKKGFFFIKRRMR
jgi:hypothetical protein